MVLLAFRNVVRQAGRTLLSMSAIALGVAGLIIAGGFVEDVFIQLGEATIHSQLGHVQVARHGYFEKRVGSAADFLIEKPEALMRRLSAIPGIDDVLARLSFSALLNNGRTDLSITAEGVDSGKEARLGTYLTIVAGRPLRNGDQFGLLIGQGVADALRLAPGDTATLVVQTPQGAMNTLEFSIVGVFRSFSRDFDARAARINLSAAKELLGVDGANTIVVSVRDTRDTEKVAHVISVASGAGFDVKTWFQLSDFYVKTRALYQRQFRVLELIILGLIALSVLNSVNMSLSERIGEFGTMRALGNSAGDVFRLVLVECATLGLAGSLLGILVGVAVALILSSIGIPMPPPPNADAGYTAQIRVEPSLVVTAFATGIVSALVASVAPARRAARMDVVTALRYNV